MIAITREEMNVKLTIRLTTLLLAGAILGTGCVTSGTYKAKVADLDKAMKEEDALKQENAKLQAQVDDLSNKIAELKKQTEQIKARRR